MKNKYQILLLIFIGLLLTLTPANVYADIGSKTIGTSNTNRAISEPFQRKFFSADGRYWIFYSNGVNMVFRTSVDGNTWSSETPVRSCDNGEKFSVWFDGTYFHYAYCAETAGAPIYYRRGTPSGGAILWSPEQVAVAGSTGITYYVPCIAVDSNGYPWIGYRFVKGTSPKRPYITRSSKSDGTWMTQSGFPYDLSGWDAAAWVVAPIPLSSGKMFVIYTSFGHYIRGKKWTGTWGSEVRTLNGISSDYFSAVAEGDDVHLAFLSSTTILHTKYSFSTNSWGSEVKVKAPATSTSAPILSYDVTSGYVFCFWIASNHIFYRKSASGIWISPTVDWMTESETITGNDLLSGFYSASNGQIGLVYLTKTSKPYNIRFVSLSTPKIEKTFILIVENPGGAPSGTKYFASLSNSTHQKEIELTDPERYGTYTGSIGGLSAGEYDWRVYYSFGSVKETIASGHEMIDKVKVNVMRWSWTGLISGQKWVDCNGNGVRDQGEYTIGGWPIRLYKKINGEWVLYWEEFTGRWQLFKWGDGIYKFFNLGPGEYKVEQVEQEGWIRTYPEDGYEVELDPGEQVNGLYFGDHWIGNPDSFWKIDDKTGGIYYGTQGGLWWATYGSYAYIIPNPDHTKEEYPIGPDYPTDDRYLNDEIGGPGIENGKVRYRVYTLHGEPLGSFGHEAYEWAYDDYHSSGEVVNGKAFPGAQYFHSVNKWRATKWHSGSPANDPLAVEVELGETGFYRVAYYVLEEGARAMSYELYRDGNLIGSRLSYPTGFFKGGKYIVFLVTLRHAPQNLTMLAWTDNANAIIAGVFIDKLCEVPPAYDKTFELTVTNPEASPQGVRYLATLYQPGRTFTVELKDPDGDGKYTGTIPELDPGEYHYRFYYILDSEETTIKEGDEYIDQSMTNMATWSWKVSKSFELTVENAMGAPAGTHYYASIWNSTWSKQIELEGDGETYEGSVGDLDPGYYDWKIFCTYPINSVTETDVIAQGQNEYLGQNKINRAEWSWNFEISGKKWSDGDGDGEWDAGEEALGGWTIKLYKQVDGQWILLGSTNTIEDGEETGAYYFVNLPPGHYMVEEEPKAGWDQTFPEENHYVTLSLSDNRLVSGKNFGNNRPRGTTLTAEVTAEGHWTRTFAWTIDKSVEPDSWNLFTGDSGTSRFTITVTKDSGTEEAWIEGEVCVTNGGAVATENLAITIELRDGDPPPNDLIATATVDVSSNPILDPGETGCYDYRVDIPSANIHAGGLYKVTAVVTITNHAGHLGEPFGPSPSDTDDLPSDPTMVNDEIHVDDTNGGSWSFSASGSVSYDKTFTCNDEGTNENTATIRETKQSDSAVVTVNCYELEVTKDASTSFTRIYTWTISKTGSEDNLELEIGETADVDYEITVDATYKDSDWAVSGNIHVHNPAPIPAVINSITDVVSPDIEATINFGVTFPYTLAAGGTLTGTYTANLPDASSRTNTATVTLQNYVYKWDETKTGTGTTDFSDTADVDFSSATMTEVDESIDVSDTYAGSLGTVTYDVGTLPKTFEYTRTIGPYGEAGDYKVENTVSFVTNDNGITGSDDWTVDVHVTEAIPPSATISGVKFYDSNANGVRDGGEVGIKGWKVQLFKLIGDTWTQVDEISTGEAGDYILTITEAGKYRVLEVMPSGTWVQTAPEDGYYEIEINLGETYTDKDFGNVCLQPGTGGRTIGFWSNKNGQKLITSDDVTALNELNLYKPDDWTYPPFSGNLEEAKEQIANYLHSATAKDMKWMLSAQLIATKLNVLHGFLSEGTIVYVGPSSYVPSGFISIGEIMNNANDALKDEHTRAEQEYWKNLLDGLNNNNLPFVCLAPCLPIVFP